MFTQNTSITGIYWPNFSIFTLMIHSQWMMCSKKKLFNLLNRHCSEFYSFNWYTKEEKSTHHSHKNCSRRNCSTAFHHSSDSTKLIQLNANWRRRGNKQINLRLNKMKYEELFTCFYACFSRANCRNHLLQWITMFFLFFAFCTTICYYFLFFTVHFVIVTIYSSNSHPFISFEISIREIGEHEHIQIHQIQTDFDNALDWNANFQFAIKATMFQ